MAGMKDESDMATGEGREEKEEREEEGVQMEEFG